MTQGLTDTVAEFGLGMFADIFLQLLPESTVISDLFTGCADRDEASEDFDIPQRFLQLIIASTKFPFTRLAAIHFLSSAQARRRPVPRVPGCYRFGNVIIRARRKGGLEI